jgi:DDE family transposase/transposase-like protein DUF772
LEDLLQLDLSWVVPLLQAKYSTRRRRPPHPPLAIMRALLFQHLKLIPSWRKLALTIKHDAVLAKRLGFLRNPCHDSFSEFTIRIGPEVLDEVFRRLVGLVRAFVPDLGTVAAIDSTLVRGYSRPRKKGARKTDSDARWGVSGERLGKPVYVYGYKLQVVCDAEREIPLSFKVAPANQSDSTLFSDHLKLFVNQQRKPDVITADAGYDSKRNILVSIKHGIKPIIAYNPRRSRNKRGRRSDYLLPISRESSEWREIYSKRSSIERVFSRLKEELGLLHLKLRTISRVSVHFALCLITVLTIALVALSSHRAELSVSVEPWRY